MDMSKSSEARIKEAVNILKITDQLRKSGTSENNKKLNFINYSIIIKLKNPHMLLANEDEAFFVPHMLTHQEYKYMMEHIEELMNEEIFEEHGSEIPVPDFPGGGEVSTT